LAIDPGLRVTGFGIIEKNGASLVYIASGCIKSGDAELPDRLKIILENLREVIAQHQAAADRAGKSLRQRESRIDARARPGARHRDLRPPWTRACRFPSTPALQVKQAVVGNGHARKEQVQEMVKRLLGLAGAPSADAADALACAICHAHGGQGLGRAIRRAVSA